MLNEAFEKLQALALCATDFDDFLQRINKTGMQLHILTSLKSEGFNSFKEFYDAYNS